MPASHSKSEVCLSLETWDPESAPIKEGGAPGSESPRVLIADALVFEGLVSRLSARLASAPAAQLEDAIRQGLGQLASTLGLEQFDVWRSRPEGDALDLALGWSASSGTLPAPISSMRDAIRSLASDLRAHGPRWFDTLDQVPEPRERAALRGSSIRSFALLPLVARGRSVGVVSFATLRAPRSWDPLLRSRLRLVTSLLALALAPQDTASPSRTLAGRHAMPSTPSDENGGWRRESPGSGRGSITCESEAARQVLAQVESVAPTLATVLLTGETGTGKEVFAQAIHEGSPRRDRPMVRVNCAAIPAALIESELFGRERGAYTGALSRQIGRFELADGGTLFLDEIGDLPLESQVKLLRVLQERVVERLGGTDPIHVDVRVIAATNRDLEAAVAARTFREDLYYRLNVFPIVVPPLRDRLKDIPVMVWSFIEEFARASGKRIDSVTPESVAALQRHRWPGNVRELRNLVERAVILSKGPRLEIEPPLGAPVPQRASGTLTEIQAGHIRAVLEQSQWRVRGPGGAAERLGMKPTTLDSRMAKLGIRRPLQTK